MQLTGSAISVALQRTKKPFELRDAFGARVMTFESGSDISSYLVADYEVHGTKRCVRYLCPPRPKPFIDTRMFPVEPSYWDGRGVLRYWKDQITPGIGSRVDSYA